MAKNKEMKENLKKFRQEAEKLENTEALKKAREKFQAVESEASKGSHVLKEKVDVFKGKFQEALQDAQNTEMLKKASQFTEGISKTAKDATETIVETGQKISKTAPFKTISDTADAFRKEIDLSGARVYRYTIYSCNFLIIIYIQFFLFLNQETSCIEETKRDCVR